MMKSGSWKMSNTPEYKNEYAFMLMTFECSSCRFNEKIWNSRDGRVNHVIMCNQCGGPMRHVNYQSDMRVVDYALEPGDRFFTDMSQVVFEDEIETFTGVM